MNCMAHEQVPLLLVKKNETSKVLWVFNKSLPVYLTVHSLESLNHPLEGESIKCMHF